MKKIVFKNFFLLSLSFLTAKFVKNDHVWSRIYFISLENVLKENSSSFNSKCQPQSKARKRSNQVRKLLTLFCYLITLILGLKNVKELRVTKINKEAMAEGVWSE